MNHNAPQPSFELPPVQPDTATGYTAETPVTPERAAQPSAPTPVAPTAALPVTQPAPVVPIPVSPALDPAAQSTPQIADDNDLIEKEWVIKAKQIVAATKEDPYTQNKELSKFKADYLKKRYNKDIKVEDA